VSWPILAVGPRVLPAGGLVEVWLDGGSTFGYLRQVLVDQLVLDASDDGRGDAAIYQIRPVFDAPGHSSAGGEPPWAAR
jgi:hypothetical protein